MSEVPTSWFHCAHCGALFHAPLGKEIERTCSVCGRDPSLGVTPQALKPNSTVPKESDGKDDDGYPGKDRRRKRQKKSGGSMIILVLAWSAVMAAIVLFANRWKGREARPAEWNQPAPENRLSAEDYELLREHAEQSQMVLGNVLSHATPEQLGAFVFNQREVFSDMIRFYRMNPGTQVIEAQLVSEGISVIQLPEGPAIEGRWRLQDERLIDAVFRKQDDGEWLIDWHHFARYSEFPWGLFLAGEGPDEAEFRLLVRQRLVRQTLDLGDQPMSLVFHAPRFGRPDEPGPASPVFDLDWDTDAARMLKAGFQQMRDGRRPFRSLLPNIESDDEMMRVRVVVRRIDDEEERRFEIVEVRACHWIQVDDPGVALENPETTPEEPDAIHPE